jgi:DNA-binding CsgD family transcriptional regulator
MAEGRSNAGIARQIWIAEATVENACTAAYLSSAGS